MESKSLAEQLFSSKYGSERILHLYSENSIQESDTIEFWSIHLPLYCLLAKRLTFTKSQCIHDLIICGIIPESLSNLFSTLIQKGYINTVDSLSVNSSGSGYIGLVTSLLPSLNSWLPFGSSAAANNDNDPLAFDDKTQYYSKELFEMLKQSILNNIELNIENNIFLLSGYRSINESFTFYSFIKNLKLTNDDKDNRLKNLINSLQADDITLIGQYLVKVNVAVTATGDDSHEIIKIQAARTDVKIAITSVDFSKLQLSSTMSKLEEKISMLSTKASEHHQKAIECNRIKDKNQAIFHLKLKKTAVDTKDKLSNALITLTSTYHTMEESNVNRMIADAYKSSLQIMKSVREENGLTVDEVDETIDAMQEEMDHNIEISNALTENSQLTADEESDLLKELDQLMKASAEAAKPIAVIPPPAPSQPITTQQTTPLKSNQKATFKSPVAKPTAVRGGGGLMSPTATKSTAKPSSLMSPTASSTSRAPVTSKPNSVKTSNSISSSRPTSITSSASSSASSASSASAPKKVAAPAR